MQFGKESIETENTSNDVSEFSLRVFPYLCFSKLAFMKIGSKCTITFYSDFFIKGKEIAIHFQNSGGQKISK